MINLKRVLIFICIILVIFCIYILFFKILNRKENLEIIPEQEITEEQNRQTIISLYFKSNDKLLPEARIMDSKELLNDPYRTILELLINGPKNSNLEGTIPNNTKINKVERVGDTLIIDFSEEFINNHKGSEIEEKITINSILKTITQLNEINKIKILINGEENKSFNDNLINFNNEFKNIL